MTRPSLLERILLVYARRFPIERGKLRIVNRLWRMAAARGETRRDGCLAMGGFKIPCELADSLSRQNYFFGTYYVERDLIALWQALARDAETVFDVGANAGIYSLATLAVRPTATVHAFEPTPELVARLRATVILNSLTQLHVHACAASNRDGEALMTIFRGEDEMNEGMNRGGPHRSDSLAA